MPDLLKQHESLGEREEQDEKDPLVVRILEGENEEEEEEEVKEELQEEEEDEPINGTSSKWWCLIRKNKKENTTSTKKKTTTNRNDEAKQPLFPVCKFDHFRNGSRKKARLKKAPPPPPPPPPYPYAYDDDSVLVADRCCYPCFIHGRIPPGHPAPPGSSSSSASYYDFLKTLIEGNDFYDDDCNVHRGVQ